MAIEHNEHHQDLLDALYCEDERWVDEDEYEEDPEEEVIQNSFFPLFLLKQDLFWEDEELVSLFKKEKETHDDLSCDIIQNDPFLCLACKEAVEWILKVNAHYGFSALTAILAINYLHRFLSSFHYQKDNPWMIQLVAVTCLSLAAKVEETQVPLLLDFQVGDEKYVFEAKTIQRMELLVLSSLKWRMNPVTPLSFLDHIIRRLGLNNHIHWEFLRQCQSLLLNVMPDCRFLRYMPSILATATMLHVIHQVEPCNAVDYQNQLLGVLKISKEKVSDCYELMTEVSSSNPSSHKRKNNDSECVTTMNEIYSSESSNDSWVSQTSSSFSHHNQMLPLFKKRRVQEQQMKLASLSRVFVDAVESPR